MGTQPRPPCSRSPPNLSRDDPATLRIWEWGVAPSVVSPTPLAQYASFAVGRDDPLSHLCRKEDSSQWLIGAQAVVAWKERRTKPPIAAPTRNLGLLIQIASFTRNLEFSQCEDF